ncbi:stage II sporulation protein P [Bhargavaea cecembensis]|uniref:stage II sporulation protein P n=1 Tax=Bhargavaea cecembensis TaxID=394098 RepID=UPI000591662F|nr:stage II sporulation protein P [Bhargavaea cecembensis]
MKQSWQFHTLFILFLFLLPILIIHFPGPEQPGSRQVADTGRLVYAANLFDYETDAEADLDTESVEPVSLPAGEAGDLLMYFTHSDEAFAPIVKAKHGTAAVFHETENVMHLGSVFSSHFKLHGLNLDVLNYDNAGAMKAAGIPHSRAYEAIRPQVKKTKEAKEYSLILDIHRDSLGRNKTTLAGKDGSYAKVYFVIGVDHPGYRKNMALAEKVSAKMNEHIPGISKGLITKGGRGVNGVYNQDLDPSLLLIEMGGTENTEDELNRTAAVIAKAAAEVLREGK